MASGWDPGTKTVIRFNSRNSGPTIWEEDAIAAQAIDPEGHDVNDQTLADSITETLNINGINAMLAPLDFGGFKGVGMLAGTDPTDAANVGQIAAQGMSWTQHNASGTMAIGARWAGLFFGANITYTLPAVSGDLPATGPTDMWIFNGNTSSTASIIIDPSSGAGGHLYVNGVALASGATQAVLPGQTALIVQAGSIEANAYNVTLFNAGDDTAYGVSWAANTRPPTKKSVFDRIESLVVAIASALAGYVPNTGNTSIAGVKTFSSDPIVPTEAYGIGWSGSNEPPTKGDTYTKIQSIVAGTGTAWLIKNSSFAPAYGGYYSSFSHSGYSVTLPAGIATPGVFPNSLVILNCDISGANTITINPPSLGVIYLEGVSLGVDVGYALLQGQMATIITVGTDIYLLHVS